MIDPLIDLWTFVDIHGVEVMSSDWDEKTKRLNNIVVSAGTWSAGGGIVCYNPPLIAVARREGWPRGQFVVPNPHGGFGSSPLWNRDNADVRVAFQPIGIVGLELILNRARDLLACRTLTEVLGGSSSEELYWRDACLDRGIPYIELPLPELIA